MKKPKRISLTNLDRATAQEVFNWGAYHLLTQGKKSLNMINGVKSCAYRGEDGTACAAGGFLTDGQYRPSFEGRAWIGLVAGNHVPDNHEVLIVGLQKIHDTLPPSRWNSELARLGMLSSLDDSILKEFPQ